MSDFDRPVRVALGPHGSVAHVVTDATRAAEKLLNEWPTTPGKNHLAARRAVLKALENAADATLAAKARTAFEKAAEEAGILLPPQERPTGGKSFHWGKKRKR